LGFRSSISGAFFMVALAACAAAPSSLLPDASPPAFALRSPRALEFSPETRTSPQALLDEDRIGCVSEIRRGLWGLSLRARAGSHAAQSASWQTEITSILHCEVFAAGGQNDIDGTDFSRFIRLIYLGADPNSGRYLFAWQFYQHNDADYLLLSAPDETFRTEFDVLDPGCSHGEAIEGPAPFKPFGAAFCIVNTEAALIATARDAATRPPIGTMKLVKAATCPRLGPPRGPGGGPARPGGGRGGGGGGARLTPAGGGGQDQAGQPPVFTTRFVEAGNFASLSGALGGRGTRAPPQLGHLPLRAPSAQDAQ
jgi:hypothetical protein